MSSLCKLLLGGAVAIAFVLGMTVQSLSERSRIEEDRVEVNRLRFELAQWQCRWMTLAVESEGGEQKVKEFMDSQTEITVSPPKRECLEKIRNAK
ncbi:MAG: hypothetical protein C5B49_08930 [Bdellovibrio sp.]|nr:MAG: hypothetical protein C5B49_08930 [Bdellovibrio sp.]